MDFFDSSDSEHSDFSESSTEAGAGSGDEGGLGNPVPVVEGEDKEAVDEVQLAVVHMVLAQPLLLEKIINLVIRGNHPTSQKPELSAKYIKICRLVATAWRDAVLQVLRDNGEPLYNLRLRSRNSLNGRSIVAAKGKLLDRFVTFYTAIPATGPAHPIGVRINSEYFRLENYDSLKSFLIHCGKGLNNLWIRISANGGSLPGAFPHLSLPALKEMEISFVDDMNSEEPRERAYYQSANVLLLLQSLFNDTPNLQEMKITRHFGSALPTGFQFLSLPVSITKLEIQFKDNPTMEFLTRNNLPNLAYLWLHIRHHTLQSEPFLEMLNSLKDSLKTLRMNWITKQYGGISGRVLFPVMPKLEQLIIAGNQTFDFEVEGRSLPGCFPNIRTLHHDTMTPAMWRKWIGGRSMPSVNEKLGLRILEGGVQRTAYDTDWLSIDLEIMQDVRRTFPNVTKLDLFTSATETEALKYLFVEMRQLTSLQLWMNDTEAVRNSKLWDSLLIGTTAEGLAQLKSNPESWKEDEDTPSIRMLTELNTFHIFVTYPEFQRQPMLSNLSFRFAFMKMPKLKELVLQGRFAPSRLMIAEWKKMGRYFIDFDSEDEIFLNKSGELSFPIY